MFPRTLCHNNISAQEPVRIKRITDQVKFDGIPDENFWNMPDTFSMTMWRPTFGKKIKFQFVSKVSNNKKRF
jgi:hypothetical protein